MRRCVTTTGILEGSDHTAREQIRLRSQWLRHLDQRDRDALEGLSLREVDARFDAWLDARRGVRDDRGG